MAGLLLFVSLKLLGNALHNPPASGGQAILPVLNIPPSTATTPALHEVEAPTGSIVLIIDDVGFDGQQIDRAMALDPNINFAVLPNGTRTADFAQLLNAKGFEVLCHLPMEPLGKESPGPNAVLTSMSDADIERVTRQNIEAVPFARGVNNHMGSRATADARVMRSVLKALPPEMYFIDSRTGEHSVVTRLAHQMNIRTAARNVFLDDVQSEKAVRHQIALLAQVAKERGVAIGIGHPHAVTLQALAAEVPALRQAGYRFIRASEAAR